MMENKKLWNDGEVKLLIATYEENPILWDVHSTNYRDRTKKQATLQTIATKFNTDCGEITRKLHNLRSQFMQEVKKIKKKKSGEGLDEVYISNWPYYSALKFIQQSVNTTETTGSLVSTFNFIYTRIYLYCQRTSPMGDMKYSFNSSRTSLASAE
jgi:hypothetical protein